jgi:hypothetical protein
MPCRADICARLPRPAPGDRPSRNKRSSASTANPTSRSRKGKRQGARFHPSGFASGYSQLAAGAHRLRVGDVEVVADLADVIHSKETAGHALSTSRAQASAIRSSPFASGKAIGAFDADADNQAVITNHGGAIVGPVGVLTLHGTVKVDELLNRCVVRVAGYW